jgi:hypothetical protein
VEGRDYLQDLGTDGRIILEIDVREIVWEVVDCSHVAQDRTSGGLF